ncbi:hypothetical protein RI367_000621 [Sorochytrium milnesiophthora]
MFAPTPSPPAAVAGASTPPADETTSSRPIDGEDDMMVQLLAIFPDADPTYLRHCLHHYEENHVVRVIDKIYQQNHGQYPQIGTDRGDPHSLDALNSYLVVLAELFPDICPLFLQDRIRKCRHKAHKGTVLTLVSHLLQLQAYPRRKDYGMLHRWDMFRDPEYVKGARLQLYNEFPDMWKSSIRAYLAENHNDYLLTHTKLAQQHRQKLQRQQQQQNGKAAKPRFLDSLFGLPIFQRKTYDAAEMRHPELLTELQEVEKELVAEQRHSDEVYAAQVNDEQYEAEQQSITCLCCYSDMSFESMVACTEGHMFCRQCVQRYVKEGLFGHGSLRGKLIGCMAGGAEEACTALFSDATLAQTLDKDTYGMYTRLLGEAELASAGLDVVACPFCGYAEAMGGGCALFDHQLWKRLKQWVLATPAWSGLARLWDTMQHANVTVRGVMAAFATVELLFHCFLPGAWLQYFALLLRLGLLSLASFLLFRRHRQQHQYLFERHQDAGVRKLSPTFLCRRPSCGKRSCQDCMREYRPFHSCYADDEKTADNLRLFVERAMSEAVKRVCPACSLAFTKSDGCNLVKCTRCGYVMCYVCRKDIKKEKYADEEDVRRDAGRAARQEWLTTHATTKVDKQTLKEVDTLLK